MTDGADQKARDMAQQALSRLDGHEDVCGVRYAALEATLKEIKGAIRLHTAQMWAAQAAVLVALIGVVAWLADRAF